MIILYLCLTLNGYAKKVTDTDSEAGKMWYIPHHGVYHPKKPENIRVVFYCSAEFRGTSLNRELLQGSDLTNQLIGVLTRFRNDQVAIIGDIESIFYQVKVPENQYNFLRYVWYPCRYQKRGYQQREQAVIRWTNVFVETIRALGIIKWPIPY